MVTTVFYDNDYRRMVTNGHKFGDAIPIPVGARFLVEFPNGVPEDEDASNDKGESAKAGNGDPARP